MFVCICKSVTDNEIREAVDKGVSSIAAMRKHLSVGTACGACTCEVKQIMENKLNKELQNHTQSNQVRYATFA